MKPVSAMRLQCSKPQIDTWRWLYTNCRQEDMLRRALLRERCSIIRTNRGHILRVRALLRSAKYQFCVHWNYWISPVSTMTDQNKSCVELITTFEWVLHKEIIIKRSERWSMQPIVQSILNRWSRRIAAINPTLWQMKSSTTYSRTCARPCK